MMEGLGALRIWYGTGIHHDARSLHKMGIWDLMGAVAEARIRLSVVSRKDLGGL